MPQPTRCECPVCQRQREEELRGALGRLQETAERWRQSQTVSPPADPAADPAPPASSTYARNSTSNNTYTVRIEDGTFRIQVPSIRFDPPLEPEPVPEDWVVADEEEYEERYGAPNLYVCEDPDCLQCNRNEANERSDAVPPDTSAPPVPEDVIGYRLFTGEEVDEFERLLAFAMTAPRRQTTPRPLRVYSVSNTGASSQLYPDWAGNWLPRLPCLIWVRRQHDQDQVLVLIRQNGTDMDWLAEAVARIEHRYNGPETPDPEWYPVSSLEFLLAPYRQLAGPGPCSLGGSCVFLSEDGRVAQGVEPELERLRIGEVRRVCEACAEHSLGQCYECGSHIWDDHRHGNEGTYIDELERSLCNDCLEEYYVCCHECDTWMHHQDAYSDDWHRYCYDCWVEQGWACHSCGQRFGPDVEPSALAEDEYGEEEAFCSGCSRQTVRTRSRQGSACTYSIVSGSVPAPASATDVAPHSFGVEIEVEWRNGDPDAVGRPSVGGYHAYHEASPPFFRLWRAERDASVSGGEFISPVLRGAGGVAEVCATLDLLTSMGASVEGGRCGQHIHLSTARHDGGHIDAAKVQRVAAALEDVLLAVTGSLARWRNSGGYNPKLKSWVEQWIARGNRLTDPVWDRGTAYPTSYGTIEFRYPPGTLQEEQFVLNLGLCQLVMQMAYVLPQDEVLALPQRMQEAGAHVENLHQGVLFGATLLREWGWHRGGTFPGLPYSPDDDVVIDVVDAERGLSRRVELPTERDLLRRIRRQVSRFYQRAFLREGHFASEEEAKRKADEVLALFSAPSEEEVAAR